MNIEKFYKKIRLNILLYPPPTNRTKSRQIGLRGSFASIVYTGMRRNYEKRCGS